MFKLQSFINEKIPEIRDLLIKHDRPTSGLDSIENEVRDFVVRVPFIGPFSAGKSSLINAIVGEKLLAVEINPETALPTEIRYGETELFTASLGNGGYCSINREELKANNFKGNESVLHAFLPAEKLRDFPHLCVVDMPGWDSGIKGHAMAIDDYIGSSLAYIVIIPVTDGTLQQSIHSLLAELNLHEMPVTLLINKSDLKPSEDVAAVSEKVASELAGIMKDAPFEMATVSARKKDIKGLTDALASIESKAENLFTKKCGRAFKNELLKLDQYIGILLNKDNLDAEQIEARQNQLALEIKAFEEKLKSESQTLSDQIAPCVEKILSSVDSELKAGLDSLTSAAMNNGDLQGMIGQIVRSATIRGIQSEFHPRVQKYFDSIEASLPLDLASNFSVMPGDIDSTADLADNEAIKNTIKTLIGALIIKFPILAIIAPVVFEIIDFFFGSMNREATELKQREGVKQQILRTLIPDVVSKLRGTLVVALEKQVEGALREITDAVAKSRENLESALNALTEELKLSQAAFDANRKTLSEEKTRILEILNQLSEVK